MTKINHRYELELFHNGSKTVHDTWELAAAAAESAGVGKWDSPHTFVLDDTRAKIRAVVAA
jgi:hypothetical protein